MVTRPVGDGRLESTDNPRLPAPASGRTRATGAEQAAVGVGELGVHDLLLDFRALAMLLSRQRSEELAGHDDERDLNAFLLAAGLHQIIEDHLHAEAFLMQRAARLASQGGLAMTYAARAASGFAIADSLRRRSVPRGRALARRAERLALLLDALAPAAVAERRGAGADTRALRTEILEPRERLSRELSKRVLRLPNFPYGFDQSIDDCREIAARFTRRHPDRDRPILVVGIRSSGSYLAPLYRALLLAEGYRDVEALTVRPRQLWRRGEAARVRRVVERRGVVLVTDDPPTSGQAVGLVAEDLCGLGARTDSIVVALALLGPADSLPAQLRPYDAVLLPWREWSIQERLEPTAVRQALSRMLVGRDLDVEGGRTTRVAEIGEVERMDPAPSAAAAGPRGHASAVYCVCLIGDSGAALEEQVKVEGVGLGYFADPVRVTGSALARYVPDVFGVERGLLYERCPPDEWRVDASTAADFEPRLVSYVIERREALGVAADPAPRVEGYAVWRLAADVLGRAVLGPLRSIGFPVTHAATRRLLSVTRPSVIDGRMSVSNWYAPPSEGPGGAVKSNWGGGVACYDAAFDLASAGGSFAVEQLLHAPNDGATEIEDRLLEAYRSRSGEEIDPERWLLYQLVSHRIRLAELSAGLAAAARDGEATAADGHAAVDREEQAQRWLTTERALAKAHRDYIVATLFADLEPAVEGPLCAFDVDWVLETRWADFPAVTVSGALALRALMRHGFRPLLATGRSLGEVVRRCRAFGLAGGVAEYGAVVYDRSSGRVLPQVRTAERAELQRLRRVLRRLPGVYLDNAHQHAVRAVRFDERGERRSLDEETIREALATADVEQSVQVLKGGGQTDFAPRSIDKGTGLRALARELGADADAERPLAFAVGDDWPDIPMLELAASPFVVANMSKVLRDTLVAQSRVRVVRDPHGAGALQAVGSFLGHDPRRCRTCRPPELGRREQLVVAAVAGSDGPRRARIRQSAVLTALLLRARLDELFATASALRVARRR